MSRKIKGSEKTKSKSGDIIHKYNDDPISQPGGLISALDRFFGRNQFVFFIISLILTVIIGIYLFDVKISTGGDDSSYIEAAKKFIDGKRFPSWHGAFYPIFLGLLMLIFGVKIIVFKIFSFLFIVGYLILFYYTFKNKIPVTILIITLLILAINSQILYFGSQTYSEALYLFLQALTFFVFVRFMDKMNESPLNYFRLWKIWLIFGFLIFLMSITRNIGIIMLLALFFYLLIDKKFYAAAFTFISYLVFRIPFNLYKSLVWNIRIAETGGQLNEILLKNPYNKAEGTEDFAGMVTRFVENSRIYLSKHFIITIGLKNPAYTGTSIIPVIIVILLFFMALYFAFRHNKLMLFIGIYLGAAVCATFIALQQSWGQLRMIVIYIPFVILFLSWGIYQLSRIREVKIAVEIILLLSLGIILFKTSGQTADMIKENKKILEKNLKGNKYYGFTPDWINFLRMSEYVGRKYPDKVVASRKPSMSFIYSKGKEFYPIYRIPLENADTLIQNLRERYDDLCFIDNSEFGKKNVPGNVQMNFKRVNLAFVGKANKTYGIYKVQDNYKEFFYSTLDKYNVNYITEVDTFLRQICKEKCYGVYPDSLINMLKKNKVDYVIMASLRVNPKERTNRTLNAVKRFLYYIELKYPGTFIEVSSIPPRIKGENHDEKEPAYLLKVNYDKYNSGDRLY